MTTGISRKAAELAARAMEDTAPLFGRIDAVAFENTGRVLGAFRKHRVSETMFAGTTGYGYDDAGREALDRIYADVFGAEAALVRTGFVNGTHAISAALFAASEPGGILLSATGLPYDTLRTVIGISGDLPGTLRYYGTEYRQTDLKPSGEPDIPAIRAAASDPRVTAVAVQRSRGYEQRPALTVAQIGEIAAAVHDVNP